MSSQKSKKYNFIILIFSVLLSLYLCEGYLSYLKYKNSLGYKVKVYKKETGKKYDTRSLLDVYNDEKKNEDVAIRYLPQILLKKNNDEIKNLDLFPLSGISNIKTIFCNEEGFFSSYISDRYGFNNPDEVWNKDEIDTIIIGDSFVHGMCVNRPDDIPSVIRNLTKKNVINLGYRGNGPLIEYATLKEYLYKPVKNLVWVYYENDLMDLQNELKNETLKNYINNNDFSQNLLTKQNKINLLNKKLIKNLIKVETNTVIQNKKNMKTKNKILKFIRFDGLKNFIISQFNMNETDKIDLPYNEFEKILKNVKKITIKNSINLYFVYLPSINNYLSKRNNPQHKKIIEIIQELDIDLIDLHQDFFEKKDNPTKYYTFNIGTHFNTMGYREVSKYISQKIYD
tara:strand:- start:1040 stop:2233 length:1194 start_codon:yes stop_codon:yes gene_type:complete